MSLLYHYSSVLHLSKILEAGFLKVVESNISMEDDHAGPDVVWLTDERNLLGIGDAAGWSRMRDPKISIDKTAVRFSVEITDAVRWRQFSRRHRIDPEWYATLNRSGGMAASHWWVVERPIPREQWTGITVKTDTGQLLDIDPLCDIEDWGDHFSIPAHAQHLRP